MLHGGDIYTDGLLKGRELLDFSSNINPLGVPKSFTDHIEEGLSSLTRYPDIKYREVLKNLSRYTGIKEEYFILGNGAAEVIDLAISSFYKILLTVPSFAEYEIDAAKWGCEIQYSYLTEDMDYDYEDILDKLQFSEALVIGNPNNPNGNIIDKNKFQEILDYCEEKGKCIIIDEAFIEFTGNTAYSFTSELEKYNCIFIIRALTKFFAMPGIRFGYGICGNETLLKDIRGKQNPWNVNCFAELAVKYVLKDEEYINASHQWIKEERNYFISKLSSLKIIDEVYRSYSNYVLCRLKNINEKELYDYCLDKGIVIRKAGNYRGLDGSFVRFAVKDRSSNERLLETLSSFYK